MILSFDVSDRLYGELRVALMYFDAENGALCLDGNMVTVSFDEEDPQATFAKAIGTMYSDGAPIELIAAVSELQATVVNRCRQVQSLRKGNAAITARETATVEEIEAVEYPDVPPDNAE